MRKSFIYAALSTVVALLALTNQANACTDFRLTAKDGTYVVARSLEFAADMQSNLRSSPRDRTFNNTTPNGKPALSWKAKYGYVYVDGFNINATVDGMNEASVSFEALYLPGETQYQSIPAGQEISALPYIYFGDWVLGNFGSVDEVRQALSNIYVYQQNIPGMGNTVFPLHAMIQDKTGKAIVVEFVGGKMYVYDSIGVMTNSPIYPWHITNLRNYTNLSPFNPEPITSQGLTFSATGQGSGMTGLPGDASPPSRFVKIAWLAASAFQPDNAAEAINLAQHIINNVDIPKGFVRAKQGGKAVGGDYTQWVVIKDLTNKVFYYRTYGDLNLHFVSFAKIDFSSAAQPLKMQLVSRPAYGDMSDQFVGQAATAITPAVKVNQ